MYDFLHKLYTADLAAQRCRIPFLQDAPFNSSHLLPYFRVTRVIDAKKHNGDSQKSVLRFDGGILPGIP